VIRYLTEVEGPTPWTWWPHEEVGHTDEAKKEIFALLGKEDAFDTPKPVRLMRRVLEIGTRPNEDDIVLDFFAGSGTLAQAVMEANQQDGGDRQFIMVQLPEPTGSQQFTTIAEIGKERIRRAAKAISENAASTLNLTGAASLDTGFKVFKLTSPSIQQWKPDADRDEESYVQELQLFNDPLTLAWTPTGVIWEVAIREGFGLGTRYAARDLSNGNKVYDVHDPDTGQSFIICLDDHIRADFSKSCALSPASVLICRDVALDDTAAANLALQCRLKTI
jgi:adenine-specific DNA-methyltransferase